MTLPLFDPDDLPEPPSLAQAAQSANAGKPRLRVPIRDQMEMQWASLDQMLEPDHTVRMVWAAVCKLDLSSWLHDIKAVERHVGRDATDPRLLLSLWVYATLKGIGSARELDRLCREHMAYKWLCGGVSVSFSASASFSRRFSSFSSSRFSRFFSNSHRVPLSTSLCMTSVASRYKARRRSESLSLKSLITWKWSKTIFALGRWVDTAPQ